jgi:FtsH-binding integral membrane protein
VPSPVRASPAGRAWAAAGADLLAVVVFAAVGRSSHGEANDLTGLLQTAGPFLLGCLAGLALSRSWRRPLSLGVGLVVWAVTVVGGLTLRVLGGATAQLSFMVVTTVTLAVLLLGWRVVVRLVGRARSRRRTRVPA